MLRMSSDPRVTPYPFLPVLNRDKRGGAVSHIQDVIREAVVRLHFLPGTFIDKVALCARLGVSRFPVSEALGRLAEEGFVEVLPQRGTRVTRIDLGDCREAMFIRRSLETEGVRDVAPHKDKALVSVLEQNLKQQRAAMENDDRIRFHELDLAFHETLLEKLGYERVKTTVSAARAKLDRVRLFLCTPQRQAVTIEEHQAVTSAIAAGDAGAAGQAMDHHLKMVMAELDAFAAAHPEAFEARAKDSRAA